jgi:guanylate kinase
MNQVVVIAGPSGSGESTITHAILKRFPERVTRLVTATTRAPRAGEENGVDYYFFSKEEFQQRIKDGDILENTYIKNRDTYYGTFKPELDAKLISGYIVIMNPDLVGAKYFKQNYDAITIFIAPESLDALSARLRARNPEFTDADIADRRHNAEVEMQEEKPFYDYTVLNADGKLNDAISEVVEILKKEGYHLQ